MNASLRRLSLAAVAALSLAACGSKPEVVNVYNWADYIDEALIKEFETKTGIKVNYSVFDSNEALQTILFTGKSGYDIVVPSASFLEKQIKAGVYQKLDKSQLPNLANLDPAITSAAAQHDPDNAHSVVYFWGTSGVGYNVDMVTKAMPDAPVNSFAMFYDPAVIANFQKCGVTVLDAPDEVVATVLLYLGKEPMSEKDEDLEAASKVLMAIRPFVREIKSSGYLDDLANGSICLAMGWSGDVGMAAARAEEVGNGNKIEYAIPKEGAIMFFDTMAIPADAPNVKNAHTFINFLLDKSVAARNTDYVTYASPNLAAFPDISTDITGDPNVYPSAEVRAKMHANAARSEEFTRKLTRMWQTFKTGQ